MSRMIKNLFPLEVIITIIVLISGNCKYSEKVQLNDNISLFKNFPEKRRVTFENIVEYKKGIPRDIFFADSTLIVCNLSKDIDAFFYNLSLKTKSWSDGYIRKGRGPNESLGGFCGGIINNTLWLYDLTMNKVLTINKDMAIKNQQIVPKTYTIDKSYYKILLLEGNSFLAVGDWSSRYKIQQIDLNSDKKITEFGEFVGIHNTSHIDGIKDTYQAFPYLRPSGNKVLLAYRFTDVIEIYENQQCVLALHGPSMIELNVKLNSLGSYHFFQKDEKTRKSFIGGTVTEDYIYLAFSGQRRSATWSYAKYIYVYDWDGNPVRELELDRFISALAVSPDNKKLYAYDANSGFIVETHIN